MSGVRSGAPLRLPHRRSWCRRSEATGSVGVRGGTALWIECRHGYTRNAGREGGAGKGGVGMNPTESCQTLLACKVIGRIGHDGEVRGKSGSV